MPYEFNEWEREPEPLASSSHAGGPPRKSTGVGTSDPAVPPNRPGAQLPVGTRLLLSIIAAVVLVGVLVVISMLLAPHR